MLATEAESLSRQLLVAHGLADWSFAFNRRKRALGLCLYDARRIELSRYFVIAHDQPAVRDTILHEIAHALAGRTAGHGPRWKAICCRIGATPERCAPAALMPDGDWRATCPHCGRHYSRHHRPRRHCNYSCRACGPVQGLIKFTRNIAEC